MPNRERMSSVDTAWLRMDRPSNLMMIAGVMMFAGRMEFARLHRIIAQRLLPYRRFRQKAVCDTAGCFWEDDPHFDLDFHLQRAELPSPGGQAQLQRHVAELVGTPLDPTKPLWHFQLVENYDGGAALILRIHHCIADGIALVGVMLDLTDAAPGAPRRKAPAAERARAAETLAAEAGEADLWQQIAQPIGEALAAAGRISGSVFSKYVDIARNPLQLVDYARLGGAVAAELGQLALMPDDSATRFKGHPGLAKCVAWSEQLPLAEVKAVGKALGCSVNDMLLAAVTGALRAYLREKGDVVAGVEVRALVPVNLRPPEPEPDRDRRLGNRFGLVALLLPVGIDNPLERLNEVRRRMEALKDSYQAPVTLGLLGVMGLAPKLVQQQVLDLLAAKATAVMTNVPGPQQPLYVAGNRLEQMMFWVPQSGDIGMGVSILSYDGKVQFGLVTDRKFVDDPERIVGRFRSEFEKIVYVLMMEPWDRRRPPEAVEADLLAALGQGRRPRRAPKPEQAAAQARHAPLAASEAEAALRGRTPKATKAGPGATRTRTAATAAARAAAKPGPRVPKRFR
jgi:WS/DGAT/MGAT family acyltransferase